jgi:hypothetical protein
MNEVLFNKRSDLLVEYIDPTRNIQRIQELKTDYNLTGLDNVMILEYDGRSRVVNIAEMGEFDLSPMARGGAPVLLAFRGEQVFTSALMSILKPETETVYFLQGHGEASPTRDANKFAEAVSIQNAAVKTLPPSWLPARSPISTNAKPPSSAHGSEAAGSCLYCSTRTPPPPACMACWQIPASFHTTTAFCD